MQKKTIIILALVLSFCCGAAFSTVVLRSPDEGVVKRRVTGIGGIFFKCKNPKAVRDWYRLHLGLNTNAYGAVFEWHQGSDSTRKGFTQWSPFPQTTKYFEPSTADFMVNYRVEHLDDLVKELKDDGVTVVDTIERYDYGKFVHILDLEGNKIELWEPNDVAYEQLGVQMGAKTTM